MKLSFSIVSAVAASSMLFASGCGRDEVTGPPELKLGRNLCAECGMMINEDRCSGAAVIAVDGVREHVTFDDIGCMLEYSNDLESNIQVIERYVHDHTTRAWVGWSEAWFVRGESDKIPTPMGSGIVAFANRDSAEQAREVWGGEVVSSAELGVWPSAEPMQNVEVSNARAAGDASDR